MRGGVGLCLLCLSLLVWGCGGSGGSGGSTGAPNPTTGSASGFASLSGRVVDIQGNPAVGATVQVVGTTGSPRRSGKKAKGEDVAGSATVDQEGRFQVSSLPAGTYNVWVGLSGASQAAVDTVTLPGGGATDTGTITLSETGTIQGRALRVGGGDHAGIDVYILGSPFLAGTETAGNYTLAGVPPGNFRLYAVTANGDAAATSPVSVTLAAGEVVQAPDLYVVAVGGAVVGSAMVSVVDSESGQAVEGAQVQLGSVTLQTDAAGSCLFPVVLVGGQSIVVTREGYQTKSDIVDIVGGIQVSKQILLDPLVFAPDLTVSPSGPNELTLSWGPQANAVGFDVFRSLEPGGPFVKLNGTPVQASPFTDTGLSQLSVYSYQVQAIGPGGVAGRPSAVVSAQAIPLYFNVIADFYSLDLRYPIVVNSNGELLGLREANPNTSYRSFGLPGLNLLATSQTSPDPLARFEVGGVDPRDNSVYWLYQVGVPDTRLAQFDSSGGFLRTLSLPPGLTFCPPTAGGGPLPVGVSNIGQIVLVGGGQVSQFDSNGNLVAQTTIPNAVISGDGVTQLRGFWDFTVDSGGTVYGLMTTTTGWQVARVNSAGGLIDIWSLVDGSFSQIDQQQNHYRSIRATPGGKLHVLGVHPDTQTPFLQVYAAAGQLLTTVELAPLGYQGAQFASLASGALNSDLAGNVYVTLIENGDPSRTRIVKLGPLL